MTPAHHKTFDPSQAWAEFGQLLRRLQGGRLQAVCLREHTTTREIGRRWEILASRSRIPVVQLPGPTQSASGTGTRPQDGRNLDCPALGLAVPLPKEANMSANSYWGDDEDDAILSAIDEEVERGGREDDEERSRHDDD